MIPITRGQAIEMATWPPCQVVHACWISDAVERTDAGHGNVAERPVVVTACGDWAASEDVRETNAPIDCMTCLVLQVKCDRGQDERK